MKNKKKIQASLIIIVLGVFFIIVSWFIIDNFILSMSLLHFLAIEAIRSIGTQILKWEKRRLFKWSEVRDK